MIWCANLEFKLWVCVFIVELHVRELRNTNHICLTQIYISSESCGWNLNPVSLTLMIVSRSYFVIIFYCFKVSNLFSKEIVLMYCTFCDKYAHEL